MAILVRLVCAVLIVVGWVISPIFWVLRMRKRKIVPVIENTILLISATQLSKKIRRREISCVEVISAYIERIKIVNPIVNAVVESRFTDALVEAKLSDEFLANTLLSEDDLEASKPLLGVPITVKESCCLKGLSYAVGCLSRQDLKASEDGIAVRNLRDSGAIPLLVSNTPEYCIGMETNNLISGTTNNPYNTNMTSGGSSGGEGALIGSGASLVGIGSDFGGSIRIPAMFNGIFGHKPTPRVVPNIGHFPYSQDDKAFDYFSMGPMTRYAEDLKLILKLMIDINSDRLELNKKVDCSLLNVILMDDIGYSIGIIEVQNEIRKAMKTVMNYLVNECGLNLVNRKFNDFKHSAEMSTSLFLNINERPNFLQHPTKTNKNLSYSLEILKSIVGRSKLSSNILSFISIVKNNGWIPRSKYQYYLNIMEQLKEDIINDLGTNGILLFPTFPTTAIQHNQTLVKYTGVSYSMVFNILGLPSTNVPIGLDSKGMPMGIQVIAAPYQDKLCLAIAEVIGNKFGGWIPPYKN